MSNNLESMLGAIGDDVKNRMSVVESRAYLEALLSADQTLINLLLSGRHKEYVLFDTRAAALIKALRGGTLPFDKCLRTLFSMHCIPIVRRHYFN